MRYSRRGIAVLLLMVLLLCTSIATSLAASATSVQDGLELILTTDKTDYHAGETVAASARVKNTGTKSIRNIVISITGPKSYVSADGSNGIKEIDVLRSGQSTALSVPFKPFNAPGTGDSSNLALWLVLLPVSAVIAICLLAKKRAAQRFLSVLMVFALAATCVTVPDSALAQTDYVDRVLTVSVPITLDGRETCVTAGVTYQAEAELVTREDWICSLMSAVDLETNPNAVVYFDDYGKAANPKAIQTAIDAGILPVELDEDYVAYVRPDEIADRDFVAYTANLALQMEYSGSERFECNDLGVLPHPEASRMAVDMGMLALVDGAFKPENPVTAQEKETSIAAIKKLIRSADEATDGEDFISYADGVAQSQLDFVDNGNGTLTIENPADVQGWERGEVHVLHSMDSTQQDIAIKVVSVTIRDGKAIVEYTQPQLHEVVTEFDVSGSATRGGYFIPAEGVTVEQQGLYRASRAATSGTLPLFGAKSFSFVHGDTTFSGKIALDSIDYRFSASPMWRFPFISIDEVYGVANLSFEVSASQQIASNSDSRRVLLGVFAAVPLGYGFFASGAVYMDLFSGDVSIELSWGFDTKVGVQYTSSQWIRPICRVNANPLSLKLKGQAKLGPDVQLNVNFLGITLLAEGVQTGLAAQAELTLASTNLSLGQFCADAKAFLYLTLYTQIGPDDYCRRYEKEVFNDRNSIWSKPILHIEETGIVSECTRDKGDYAGVVVDAQTGQPIYHAKVMLYKWDAQSPQDTTFTDSSGVFKGVRQSAGRYKLRVIASGYLPYECTVDIIGGNTTQIAPQLMIQRDTPQEGLLRGTVSGYVTDAMTGNRLSGVTVSFYNAHLTNYGSLAGTARTDANGYFSTTLNIGVYDVTFNKSNYIPSGRFLTMIGDTSGFNASMNPENQSPEFNSLRAVLEWGSTPRDLDSHLVGPQDGGRFHTYFSNRVEANANLDVDDVDGYGPETTTIVRNQSGTYSFYVHDYTNRMSGNSAAMSYSGAYIKLYNGNDLLYTIQIPTGQGGTLWHVFDYDGDTRRITLVNSFSYESSPSAVGSNGRRMRSYNPEMDLKPYVQE